MRTPYIIHEQLRQHILEAELGSSITISFAKKPAVPLPTTQSESQLVKQLKADDKEVRWSAAEKLSYSANKDVVLALIAAMNDKSGTRRVCVMAQALGHLKDPRALSALTQAAFDPYNRDLRLCAIRSIGMIGDRSAVPDLIRALKQNNTPIQTANTLARLGDSRAVIPLIEAAENQTIRPWMIRALGDLGNTEAVKYLTTQLISNKDSENSKQNMLLEESLWKISILSQYDSTAALSQVLLYNPDSNKRMWAAYRLGESKNITSVYHLITSLRDSDNDVAGRAAAALVRMKDVSLQPVRYTLKQKTDRGSEHLTVTNRSKSQQNYLYAVMGYIGNKADIKNLQMFLYKDETFGAIIEESLQLIKNSPLKD
jgi:HEAT repeat protein